MENIDIKECCNFFEENYNIIKDNLKHIRKEKDVAKITFLLHSISLYKEIYFLLQQKQILAIPILLRSALECFLKLNDIQCNGKNGINRIRVSDYKEKLRLYSIIKEIEPEYDIDNSKINEIKKEIDKLKNNIDSSQDKEFKLTKQAVSYNKNGNFMRNAIFILSKHTHCNESLVTSLHHIIGCNDLFLIPQLTKEMELEFLKIVNFLFIETISIYNSMTDIPIYHVYQSS